MYVHLRSDEYIINNWISKNFPFIFQNNKSVMYW